jgi:uncharacterized protein involved in propanediol utilization
MSKLFSVAGVSTLAGERTFRFANTMDRVKGLMRSGHTDVELMELPTAMTKEDAVAYLATKGVTAELKSVRKSSAPVVKVTASKTTRVVAKTKPVAKSADDELDREAYAEAMFERKANDMPTMSFAEWKRNKAKAAAFFAQLQKAKQPA